MLHTYHSKELYTSDYDKAYKSALAEAELCHNSFTVFKHEFDSLYCEGCGDYHVYCTITVSAHPHEESDLAIKLQQAINRKTG